MGQEAHRKAFDHLTSLRIVPHFLLPLRRKVSQVWLHALQDLHVALVFVGARVCARAGASERACLCEMPRARGRAHVLAGGSEYSWVGLLCCLASRDRVGIQGAPVAEMQTWLLSASSR